MKELRIRKLPDDLREQLEAMAKRDGISLRHAAIMLLRIGQSVDTIRGQNADKVRTNSGQTADKVSTPSKFTPPTLAEVTEFIAERKSAVDPVAFWNYYESNGWKVGKNPMRNWKAAVGTWERNPEQGRLNYAGQQQQRQVSAAERRSEHNKRAILEGIARANRDRAKPDGGELEGDTGPGTDD